MQQLEFKLVDGPLKNKKLKIIKKKLSFKQKRPAEGLKIESKL